MRIVNLENNNRKIIRTINNFHVLEYVQDASVSPMNAIDEYFMSKMNVRRRQVVIDISRDHSPSFRPVPCSGWVEMYRQHPE